MGKIDSLEEQRLVQVFGQGIGEAIAEVQASWMHAFAPAFMGSRDPSRGASRHRDDVEAQSVDQACHFFSDISAGGDDHGLSHRPG